MNSIGFPLLEFSILEFFWFFPFEFSIWAFLFFFFFPDQWKTTTLPFAPIVSLLYNVWARDILSEIPTVCKKSYCLTVNIPCVQKIVGPSYGSWVNHITPPVPSASYIHPCLHKAQHHLNPTAPGRASTQPARPAERSSPSGPWQKNGPSQVLKTKVMWADWAPDTHAPKKDWKFVCMRRGQEQPC